MYRLRYSGTGEAEYENSFRYFAAKYPNRFAAVIDFDISLAQQMYAGTDLFLMPSAFEPCGLSQMISLRYGTLPIVHETGGLKDTVVPYNAYTGEGTGFAAKRTSAIMHCWVPSIARWMYMRTNRKHGQ